jgi:hypothetical protein
VKIVKNFVFKAGVRNWSNRYHFNGGLPADTAHWNTLFDAIVAAEKLIYPNTVNINTAIGYAAGSDVPIATKTYSQLGTASLTSGNPCPGEVAALLRYGTTAKTPKNHPVYLFNYYHGVWDASSAPDLVNVGQKSLIETYAGSWMSGFTDGVITAVRAGPNGATATGHAVNQYLTHRDFPR